MSERRRVGVIVPSTNTTVEPDFNRLMPDDVTVHGARLWATNTLVSSADRLNQDVPMAATYLATAGLDVIVYACTGGSFYKGRGFDQEMHAQLKDLTGAEPVVTAIAAVQALQELGVGKVMIVTPYPDEPGEETELLQKYLEDYGFDVVGRAGKGIGKTTNREVGNDTPDSIYKFVVEHWESSAEGLFVSCTDWRALEIVDQLERELGVPVVTSNQAAIWATLRTLGKTTAVIGYGKLLEFDQRTAATVTASA